MSKSINISPLTVEARKELFETVAGKAIYTDIEFKNTEEDWNTHKIAIEDVLNSGKYCCYGIYRKDLYRYGETIDLPHYEFSIEGDKLSAKFVLKITDTKGIMKQFNLQFND